MFERRVRLKRTVRFGHLGMEYEQELDDTAEDDYESDTWTHGYNNFWGVSRLSDMNSDRGLSGNQARSSNSVYQPPVNYLSSADLPGPSATKVQTKNNDIEREAKLLQETKKNKEKAEKKKLKKQKRKEKCREKLGKEEQNPLKVEEGKGVSDQSKEEERKPSNDESKDNNSSVKQLTSTKDSNEDESSDDDSDTKNDSCDSEELDITSAFVTKAALIAKRKLEAKARPERKEKKLPDKDSKKTVPGKPKDDPEVKKDPVAPSIPSIEDNIKISTELAVLGNNFASSGDFKMAVKYFTDAIKHNPKEFKLFGNRSFCFERMQEYEKALIDAELCLNMCPVWVKGLFRKGRALAGLKRYEEAAQAFREVLKLEGSYTEAYQELKLMQLMQLMEHGFTQQQSLKALNSHGTVEKALEALSKFNHRPGVTHTPAQVVNVTGVSPILKANKNPAHAHLPQSQDVPKTSLKNCHSGQVENMSNIQSEPRRVPNPVTKMKYEKSNPPMELFPVWVGNLIHPVTESTITNLFNEAGAVFSVKVLATKRCAFVNFTKPEYCDEAIRRFHGFELNNMKLAVRYPDRIPPGMGISKSALRADDLQDEDFRQTAFGSRRPVRPFGPVSGHGDFYKH
ncbi:hsp70-Hsp90 organizing protein 1-like isoform X2 [Echeneis naucrates]|nr:hsp70-Hsp90 organizing protein 1-like isoform X2 [Echeneis naucrates]